MRSDSLFDRSLRPLADLLQREPQLGTQLGHQLILPLLRRRLSASKRW